MRSLRILLRHSARRGGGDGRKNQSFAAPTLASLPAGDASALRVVLPLVPTTFTTVSQVARTVGRKHSQQGSSWDAGTIERLARTYPSLFDIQPVGGVVTIRRQPTALATLTSAAETGAMSTHSSSTLNPASHAHREDGAALTGEEVATLTDVFPSFCVPLSALIATAADLPGGDLLSLIMRYRTHLLLLRPHTDGPRTESETPDTLRLAAAADTACLSLSPQFLCQYVHPSSSDISANRRWAAWRVEEYEWLRVARLLPSARSWAPLTADLVTAAQHMLPEGRNLLHVLFSASHLFRVRQQCSSTHSEQAGVPGPSTRTPELLLWARFQLPEDAVPVVQGTAESLQAELSHLQSQRFEKGARTRRRDVQRQLTYLLNPSPLLDLRVLAQYIFDLLPTDSGVSINNLLNTLPDAVRCCLPPDLTTLWSRDDLFFVHFSGTEKMVQRADVRRPASREAESVSAMEILQDVYRQYPLGRHPDEGTCLFRVLPKLSPLVRDRLFQLRDAEELVLRRFPDKVEVCGAETQLMAQQLAACKGRTDFFVSFRFVGDWHTRLLRRFEASLEKRWRRARPSQR